MYFLLMFAEMARGDRDRARETLLRADELKNELKNERKHEPNSKDPKTESKGYWDEVVM